jgi:hypothetical protein
MRVAAALMLWNIKLIEHCRDIGALDKAFPGPDTAGTIGSILSWSSALSARAAMTLREVADGTKRFPS